MKRNKSMMCPYCNQRKAKVEEDKLGFLIHCSFCKSKLRGFDTAIEAIKEWKELFATFDNLEKNGHNPRKQGKSTEKPSKSNLEETDLDPEYPLLNPIDRRNGGVI